MYLNFSVVSQNTPPPAGTHNKADISEEDKARYNKLVSKGKELTHQGKVQQALECNKQALAIYRSDKLAKRVRKMEVNVQVAMFVQKYHPSTRKKILGIQLLRITFWTLHETYMPFFSFYFQ